MHSDRVTRTRALPVCRRVGCGGRASVRMREETRPSHHQHDEEEFTLRGVDSKTIRTCPQSCPRRAPAARAGPIRPESIVPPGRGRTMIFPPGRFGLAFGNGRALGLRGPAGRRSASGVKRSDDVRAAAGRWAVVIGSAIAPRMVRRAQAGRTSLRTRGRRRSARHRTKGRRGLPALHLPAHRRCAIAVPGAERIAS